jgi:hypothetical protein
MYGETFMKLAMNAEACMIIEQGGNRFITHKIMTSCMNGNPDNILVEFSYYDPAFKETYHYPFCEGDFDDEKCTIVSEDMVAFHFDEEEKILIKFLSPTKINP